MSQDSADLSGDERNKIAAYHQALADRQAGVVKVAESVRADGGMSAGGEMPSGAMEPDRPLRTARAAPGEMPRPPMN